MSKNFVSKKLIKIVFLENGVLESLSYCGIVFDFSPRLTWRDVQHLVVRTARHANLDAADWVTNGVGRNISHSFGYGLMDAVAMVRMAKDWVRVGDHHRCMTVYGGRNMYVLLIFLFSFSPLSHHLTFTQSIFKRLETVHEILLKKGKQFLSVITILHSFYHFSMTSSLLCIMTSLFLSHTCFLSKKIIFDFFLKPSGHFLEKQRQCLHACQTLFLWVIVHWSLFIGHCWYCFSLFIGRKFGSVVKTAPEFSSVEKKNW